MADALANTAVTDIGMAEFEIVHDEIGSDQDSTSIDGILNVESSFVLMLCNSIVIPNR